MDLKQAVILALQVSIAGTVLGFGLSTTMTNLLYLVSRPGLLARSILSIFVIVPIIAVGLVLAFDFPRDVEVVLLALGVSPIPPILPKKGIKAGGNADYALGLMALMALLSIVAVPMWLEILERISGRPVGIGSGVVAALVAKTILIPLATGLAIRALAPSIAARIEKAVGVASTILLVAGVILLLAGMASALAALINIPTILAITIFTLAGLAVGHMLGAPDREHSTILALSSACRHPGMAFTLVTANFPGQQFIPLILFYLILSAIVGIPYLKWQRSRA